MSPRPLGYDVVPLIVTRGGNDNASPGAIVVYGTRMTNPAMITTTSRDPIPALDAPEPRTPLPGPCDGRFGGRIRAGFGGVRRSLGVHSFSSERRAPTEGVTKHGDTEELRRVHRSTDCHADPRDSGAATQRTAPTRARPRRPWAVARIFGLIAVTALGTALIAGAVAVAIMMFASSMGG